MVTYLKNKFALSNKGASDLIKSSISCALTDLSLMFPILLLYFLLEKMLIPILGGKIVSINIWGYILWSIVILALMFIFQYIQYNKTFFSSYEESANKRITLAEKLRILPLSFFGKRDLADLTTTIMGDCAGLETAFSHYIPQLIGSTLSVIIASIGLIIMNWKMAIALLWVVPVAFIIAIMSKKKQDRVNEINNDTKLNNSDNIQECIEMVRELKANNESDNYLKKLDEKLQKFEKTQIKAEFSTAIYIGIAQMILKVGIATVVLVGGKLLINREVDLLTFLIFLVAASRMFDPLSIALVRLSAIFKTLVQIDRMKEIENHKVQIGSHDAMYDGYDICFENVYFSYDNKENVLKNVSFTAKQGEVTALVGPSGGGKSTVAKLSARFWDVDKGKITLGGSDISNIDPEELLKSYSIVFQDVILFNSSIMENIRIGKKNATDEEVKLAAKAAMCDEFILKMPNGYETVIGENGAILSGGERQRISIARAILKDAPVILLDEATASLDVDNETKIQEAISRLIKNKTVLIIAHKMRTVSDAHKIVVLSEGHVKQIGQPYKLLNENGIYRNMVELQNKSKEWKLGV